MSFVEERDARAKGLRQYVWRYSNSAACSWWVCTRIDVLCFPDICSSSPHDAEMRVLSIIGAAPELTASSPGLQTLWIGKCVAKAQVSITPSIRSTPVPSFL
ncbi:hypothetical protein KC19_1G028300 [Ceratodon purpureus]|uniref:Uncharacterized protein n=1 Tax=Ceratodon purpureus TaxID=3225 RepID=A0A8T0J1S4_CERPU|nr:hypothetical protein KC19_1G028300 [Ceratodon purpureus]